LLAPTATAPFSSLSCLFDGRWSLLCLEHRCQQPNDDDGSVQFRISQLQAVDAVLHKQIGLAIYASLALFMFFVYQLDVRFAEAALDSGRVFR
jgi:hypothetical protein